MGYRWYDAHNIKPMFEFGYGLSCTSRIRGCRCRSNGTVH